ncbi:MAG: SpoIVB peptidase [Clostridium sp. SCN 57-10]|nr:MAG: SpoIVB peptidase [Clostridium sp. SCN 57-10]
MKKKRKLKSVHDVARLFGAVAVAAAVALLVFPAPADTAVWAPADSAISVSAISTSARVYPSSKKLIPLGRTTGITLFSDGSVIIGFASVDGVGGQSPAKTAGLQCGDIIKSVNGVKVDRNDALVEQLCNLKDPSVCLTVEREGAVKEYRFRAVSNGNGGYRIGAWVRDSIAGIGTITYIDPENGAFGALGHGICDAETGSLIPFDSGALLPSSVKDVRVGRSGAPGELSVTFDGNKEQGVLYDNTQSGIYGRVTEDTLYTGQNAVETAARSEIREGKAIVLANVEGTSVSSYEIEIIKIYAAGNGEARDMMIRVTDPVLLEKTGGIVQGMSGSPILQNGKLVGAVTHVLVNDPTRGYAISIERMLEAARST